MEKKRISRNELYLRIADLIALRGTCQRAQVGAVITMENRIISTGYNGPATCDKECQAGTCDLNSSCQRAIHAEANAIAFAAREGISLKGGTLYCNYSPCIKCAELITQSGIAKVVFRKFYRQSEGIDLLVRSNVSIQIQQDAQ